MTALQSIHPSIVIQDGKPMTSSTNVAAVFGKQHRNVIRAIERLNIPSKWRLLNFEQTVIERENPSGGKPIESPAYDMTRDGFTILVMGFTGKAAMAFKLAYIDAFNAMEKRLRTPAMVDGGERAEIAAVQHDVYGLQSAMLLFDGLVNGMRRFAGEAQARIDAVNDRLDERDQGQRVLDYVKAPECTKGYYTITDLAAPLGMATAAAYQRLMDAGVLVRDHRGRYAFVPEHAYVGMVNVTHRYRSQVRIWPQYGNWAISAIELGEKARG